MKSINYIVLSDVHLGHRQTPTEHIVTNLKTVISTFKGSKLDIIFIAGDLFDRLLDNSMDDVTYAQLWMCWLLRFCETHAIKLRVLEGTRSHDRGQSSQFSTVYSIADTRLDFKYIPYLSIETIEDLGISILYVPDEWHEDTSETYRQVQSLLEEHHLNEVDIAIMHGQFGYQLPLAPASVPRHIESDYLSIVKHYIHIGHVHVYSIFDRIIAQGSFDRLAHGEEAPKGLVYAEIRSDGSHSHDFIENTGAMIYKTIQVKKKTLEESIEYLDKQIPKLPIGSKVRLQADRAHPIFVSFHELEVKYVLYTLSKKTNDKADQPISVVDIQTDDYQVLSITKENLPMLLKEVLITDTSLTPPHWSVINQELENV